MKVDVLLSMAISWYEWRNLIMNYDLIMNGVTLSWMAKVLYEERYICMKNDRFFNGDNLVDWF